jgi:hypothetical protein
MPPRQRMGWRDNKLQVNGDSCEERREKREKIGE